VDASDVDADIPSDESDDDPMRYVVRRVLTDPKEPCTVARSTGTGRCRDSNGSNKRRKLDLHAVGRAASADGRFQWTDEGCSIPSTDSDMWEKVPLQDLRLADVPQVSSVMLDQDLSALPQTGTAWETCQQVPMPQEVPQALNTQGTAYVPALIPALIPALVPGLIPVPVPVPVPLHAHHIPVAWSPGASPDDSAARGSVVASAGPGLSLDGLAAGVPQHAPHWP
jgi:hypothetical protein